MNRLEASQMATRVLEAAHATFLSVSDEEAQRAVAALAEKAYRQPDRRHGAGRPYEARARPLNAPRNFDYRRHNLPALGETRCSTI